MSQDKLDCYILPSQPVPMLLPVECVAEVLAKPEVEALEDARAAWMRGHVNWHNQRLPVMSFADLHTSNEPKTAKDQSDSLLIVLNPVPNAARKAYSALLCFGEVKQLSVDDSVSMAELPDGLDKRYVEAVVTIEDSPFVIPKLDALGVAFSYF